MTGQPPSNSTSSSSSGSTGVIVGVVLGVCAGAAVAVAAGYFIYRRMRAHRAESGIEDSKGLMVASPINPSYIPATNVESNAIYSRLDDASPGKK